MSVTVTFEGQEAKFLAFLLELASGKFSNHGCNDFPIENTDENWALLERMEAYNLRCSVEEVRERGDTEERPAADKEINLMDWFLMDYLAHKVRRAIEEHDRQGNWPTRGWGEKP